MKFLHLVCEKSEVKEFFSSQVAARTKSAQMAWDLGSFWWTAIRGNRGTLTISGRIASDVHHVFGVLDLTTKGSLEQKTNAGQSRDHRPS